MRTVLIVIISLILSACSDDSTAPSVPSNNTAVLDSSQIVSGPDWSASSLPGYWQLVLWSPFAGQYVLEFVDTWIEGDKGGKYNIPDYPGVRIYRPLQIRRSGDALWFRMDDATGVPLGDPAQLHACVLWFAGTLQGNEYVGTACERVWKVSGPVMLPSRPAKLYRVH